MCGGYQPAGFILGCMFQEQVGSFTPQCQKQQSFPPGTHIYTGSGSLQADHIISLEKRLKASAWEQILPAASLSVCGVQEISLMCPVCPPLFILITDQRLRGSTRRIVSESLWWLSLCVLGISSLQSVLWHTPHPFLALRNSSKCLESTRGFQFSYQSCNRLISFCTSLLSFWWDVGVVGGKHMCCVSSPKYKCVLLH